MKAFFVRQADGRLAETIIRAESLEKARTFVPADVRLLETDGDVITALGWPDNEGRYDGEFSRIDRRPSQFSWKHQLGVIGASSPRK
jgi:hypothetical protein